MLYNEVIEILNNCGRERRSCFFLLDYEQREGLCFSEPLQGEVLPDGLCFSIGNTQGGSLHSSGEILSITQISPEAEDCYAHRFDIIHKGIQHGDSFLANLTIQTPIQLSGMDLADIYAQTEAKYKVLMPGRFVCFSPETFVRIEGTNISTFPMKGTIDASLQDAERILLNDYKEHCEHCTIVDLMRNDLTRVAERVRVKRFKYLDRLTTSRGEILQMSSEVVGTLRSDWHERLGNLIDTLLPAGSISGAPKEKTCELIRSAEGQARGYYTGICGYYDGDSLDTGVLIRFVEQVGKDFYYRSGGGVTINSQMSEEYKECIQKVYLPTKQA